ncbi:hypothetical protein B0H19DRAFT_1385348 [Mycena capillaripes]|nr:hypothetical protein B0H19DRAFT_1385348 [Mycena capillaripes]
MRTRTNPTIEWVTFLQASTRTRHILVQWLRLTPDSPLSNLLGKAVRSPLRDPRLVPTNLCEQGCISVPTTTAEQLEGRANVFVQDGEATLPIALRGSASIACSDSREFSLSHSSLPSLGPYRRDTSVGVPLRHVHASAVASPHTTDAPVSFCGICASAAGATLLTSGDLQANPTQSTPDDKSTRHIYVRGILFRLLSHLHAERPADSDPDVHPARHRADLPVSPLHTRAAKDYDSMGMRTRQVSLQFQYTARARISSPGASEAGIAFPRWTRDGDGEWAWMDVPVLNGATGGDADADGSSPGNARCGGDPRADMVRAVPAQGITEPGMWYAEPAHCTTDTACTRALVDSGPYIRRSVRRWASAPGDWSSKGRAAAGDAQGGGGHRPSSTGSRFLDGTDLCQSEVIIVDVGAKWSLRYVGIGHLDIGVHEEMPDPCGSRHKSFDRAFDTHFCPPSSCHPPLRLSVPHPPTSCAPFHAIDAEGKDMAVELLRVHHHGQVTSAKLPRSAQLRFSPATFPVLSRKLYLSLLTAGLWADQQITAAQLNKLSLG